LKKFKLTKHPFILTIVMLFLPRLFVLRSVGTPEPLFMVLILASLYCFEQKKFLWAGIAGGLATMAKTPGILLFVAYICTMADSYRIHKKFHTGWLYTLLIPLGLVAVFGIYFLQYKDFFAYYHTGAVVPMPYPFAAFNYMAKWVQS